MSEPPAKKSTLQKPFVSAGRTRNSYQLVFNRGNMQAIRTGNGSADNNRTIAIDHGVANQRPSAIPNEGESKVMARKSFVAPVKENVIAQVNAIQMEAEASKQRDAVQEMAQNVTSDLRTAFENNMNVFARDLEEINERYVQDMVELKVEYQTRLVALKREHERSVENAKKKVFHK